ncbi:hypothetical protein CQW23_00618 [Capsicum baccatum]|uniref:Uncharacterized protein n=1 Tax=Capsicum baccatum TaxID=33114 RepID=A0A2G2XL89_CAPBA|nr:hypothetical protein CQW23_00618 [Capsicum baccatum]
MALRLSIDKITTDTPDWTCKVQIIASVERESPEKRIRFQNLILEDEQLRKSSWVSSNATQTNLTILSYTEKKQLLPSTIENRNAKKAMSPGISGVGMEAAIIESGTSNATSSTELVAPPKKL